MIMLEKTRWYYFVICGLILGYFGLTSGSILNLFLGTSIFGFGVVRFLQKKK